MSKYDFYIIRIYSRRQIKPRGALGVLRDLKDGKTKYRFEEQLYGTVYPRLGWDILYAQDVRGTM